MTWGFVMILTRGHLWKLKVIVKKNAQFISRTYLVVDNDLKRRLDIRIACDLKICPDFELWSFVQVQSHWKSDAFMGIFVSLLKVYLATVRTVTWSKDLTSVDLIIKRDNASSVIRWSVLVNEIWSCSSDQGTVIMMHL